jgi:hypothetical protein
MAVAAPKGLAAFIAAATVEDSTPFALMHALHVRQLYES